ncbi:hypothetical protein GOD90_20340 [Sinorhizobium medicae]|nr:hypothetical protein [Sinorhizobium medicae]MDX0899304.1 hypothetical protein [Sinorhizobium medicae]MDX1120215.1 hypothetical protein [Sinorhizobium medicae]MDX1242697.1 hypothetical protein [Sinorhizobium medicae]
MTHALNLVIPIKQDAETKEKLRNLEAIFASEVQGEIERALRKSELVHFARVFVIDDKYILVITEYEGDHEEYTEFFRNELPGVFGHIFGLADLSVDVSNPSAFWEASMSCNRRSLGTATDGSKDFHGNAAGWLFSAYDHRTVKKMRELVGEAE